MFRLYNNSNGCNYVLIKMANLTIFFIIKKINENWIENHSISFYIFGTRCKKIKSVIN